MYEIIINGMRIMKNTTNQERKTVAFHIGSCMYLHEMLMIKIVIIVKPCIKEPLIFDFRLNWFLYKGYLAGNQAEVVLTWFLFPVKTSKAYSWERNLGSAPCETRVGICEFWFPLRNLKPPVKRR